MTENEIIKGWSFKETIKATENLMEVESKMFKWDVLRHLRDFAKKFKDELEQYRAIGTIDEFKSLKEKEIPKKPIIKPWSAARCPTCDCSLSESLGDGYYQHFESLERCDKCNQKLDWQ